MNNNDVNKKRMSSTPKNVLMCLVWSELVERSFKYYSINIMFRWKLISFSHWVADELLVCSYVLLLFYSLDNLSLHNWVIPKFATGINLTNYTFWNVLAELILYLTDRNIKKSHCILKGNFWGDFHKSYWKIFNFWSSFGIFQVI